MSIWSQIKAIFTIDDYYMDETFSLGDRPIRQSPQEGQGQSKQESGKAESSKPESGKPQKRGGFVLPKKPLKTSESREKAKKQTKSSGKGEKEEQSHPGSETEQINHSREIYSNLSKNLEKLKARFHIPPNIDVIIREFTIPLEPPIKGAIAFMEGLASRDTINSHVLMPLMLLSNLDEKGRNIDPVSIVMERLLPGNQVEVKDSFDDLMEGILTGTTMVLLDGYPSGLLVETKGWEHRTVSRPNVENVVRGPQEAFVEHIRVNTALVRKRLHCNTLVTEMFKLGRLSNVHCALLYIEGLTNPKLVAEVRRRIKGIDTDYISDTGTLEQFIEDNPASLLPGQLSTERPDRVAAALAEGHVAMLVDGDPFALIMPVTFWSLIHTAEDAYIRWPYGSLLRAIRILALFINLLLPSFYISIVNFHPEMIPTDLLLAIAASRESIPFPAIWEVVMMELAFDLIREAGIRIPSIIGPTLGIVGALILGQAAVAANIVSPLLVIIVALTGLGSFAIPNYGLTAAMRTLRFVFLFLSAFLGFYGLAIGVFLVVIHICGQKSVGVPIMSPVSPFRPPSGDVVYRQPVWKQEQRPVFMRPLARRRQPKITRPWATQLKEGEDRQNQDTNTGKQDTNAEQQDTNAEQQDTNAEQQDTKGGKQDGDN